MPTGTVKFFNAQKGFGFITSDDGGKDIFVPSASTKTAGIASLQAGQRASFDIALEGKGPKAINIMILVAAPKLKAPAPTSPRPSSFTEKAPRLTIYYDARSEVGLEVLAELREAGHDPLVIDYLASPPAKETLRKLSALLRVNNQSLVDRFDDLFQELRLDDRFLGESEFWDAVIEHPSLIDGPIIVSGDRASICHNDIALKQFLDGPVVTKVHERPKPRGLSERSLRILAGEPFAIIAANQGVAGKADPEARTDNPKNSPMKKTVEKAARKKPAVRLATTKKANSNPRKGTVKNKKPR